MKTVVLNVNENVSEKFMWFLSHFKKDEIEILDEEFLKTKTYLQGEIQGIDGGKTVMLNEYDLWKSTEEVIRKYE